MMVAPIFHTHKCFVGSLLNDIAVSDNKYRICSAHCGKDYYYYYYYYFLMRICRL